MSMVDFEEDSEHAPLRTGLLAEAAVLTVAPPPTREVRAAGAIRIRRRRFAQGASGTLLAGAVAVGVVAWAPWQAAGASASAVAGSSAAPTNRDQVLARLVADLDPSGRYTLVSPRAIICRPRFQSSDGGSFFISQWVISTSEPKFTVQTGSLEPTGKPPNLISVTGTLKTTRLPDGSTIEVASSWGGRELMGLRTFPDHWTVGVQAIGVEKQAAPARPPQPTAPLPFGTAQLVEALSRVDELASKMVCE